MAESDTAPSVKDLLTGLGESVRGDFTRNRRVMSFAEYLQLVVAEPTRQLRAAAQAFIDWLLEDARTHPA